MYSKYNIEAFDRHNKPVMKETMYAKNTEEAIKYAKEAYGGDFTYTAIRAIPVWTVEERELLRYIAQLERDVPADSILDRPEVIPYELFYPYETKLSLIGDPT